MQCTVRLIFILHTIYCLHVILRTAFVDQNPTTAKSLLDGLWHQFDHVLRKTKVCMVFETMGPNVLALIKRHENIRSMGWVSFPNCRTALKLGLCRYNFKGIPLDIVRKVTTHTLIGLDYLWLDTSN